jgi:RNA polymerase sigma-70 factor (ECF subfamily)
MNDLASSLSTNLDTAFPQLVDVMGSKLYWGLRRMCGDHQEAEDLTQEAFIRAYRALDGYDRKRVRELKLAPWMWTIALNLGRNHVRDRARRPTPAEIEDIGDLDPEPADSVAWDHRFAVLTEHQKTSVVLRHVVGLSIGEIAEVTGRPEGTVKSDIHRGLERLRQAMESET